MMMPANYSAIAENDMKEKRCREIYEEVTEQCQNKSELSACAVWSIP